MGVLTRRMRRGELVALDGLAGALLFVLHLLPGDLPADPGRVLTAASIAVPVVVRRLLPLTAVAVLVAGLATAAPDALQRGGMVALVLVLYAVGLLSAGWRTVAGLVAGAACGAVAGLPAPEPAGVLAVGVLAGAGWAIGRAVGVRRDYLAREADRATERAVAAERLRIARELHDVVAHSMSLIAVKSGVAALVAAERPEVAADALKTIEEISRGSLAEMRRTLGALRADPELSPAPGLSDLPALAQRTRAAGVGVDLSVSGQVPDAMALSVYRIVQEALTNVVKHAAPAHCRVQVHAADGRVRIEVTDDGPGTRTLPDQTPGHGLIGIRERVTTYGGQFRAGPRPGGGFAVEASWEIP